MRKHTFKLDLVRYMGNWMSQERRNLRVEMICYRATGDDTRSLCTTVCKWTYLGHAHLEQMSSKDSVAMKASGWDDLFWQEIGLGDLVESGYATIGTALPSSHFHCLLLVLIVTRFFDQHNSTSCVCNASLVLAV